MRDARSPCINVCSVDPVVRICIGCGRTLAEIGSWTRLSDIERLKITAQLSERLVRLKERELV
jgi:uncharacterized protein